MSSLALSTCKSTCTSLIRPYILHDIFNMAFLYSHSLLRLMLVWILPFYPHITSGSSFSEWLQHPPYTGRIEEDIQCYALPYGTIGFVSHLITWYTVFILLGFRMPLNPLNKLRHTTFNICLAVISAIGTFSISILNIARCRQRWDLVLILVGKLVLTSTWGFATILAIIRHPRAIIWSNDPEVVYENFGTLAAGFIISSIGGVFSLVGVIAIAKEGIMSENSQVKVISGVFGAFIGTILAVMALSVLVLPILPHDTAGAYAGMLLLPCMILSGTLLIPALATLFSDWILGALARDIAGIATETKTLYWLYFAFSKFMLLSI